MNNGTTIINDYLEALTKRAESAGDDKLGIAIGYFHEALRALKLQGYELETLERLTSCIEADKKTFSKTS
jgi:hypothetical protein